MLIVIGKCDPVTCAVYAKEHGLLNEPGWKQFKKYACKAKTLQRLVNNLKRAQQFGQIVYKYGVRMPRNEKEAISLDRENGNTYWQDAIAEETGCWCPIQGRLPVPRYPRLGTREEISWFLRT